MSLPVLNYFRPAFEARAAAAWGVAAVYAMGLLLWLRIGVAALMVLLLLSSGMLALRLYQANRLWKFKLGLAGRPVELLAASRFEKSRAALDGKLWLGWGYRWQPMHAQLSQDVLKRNLKEIYPPGWVLRLHGIDHDPRKLRGLQWIHGLDKEEDVLIDFAALEGHMGILATTGAIKTTLFKLMVYQFASRGDVVFVLDPKGDKDLQNICRDVPAMLGHPELYLMFHPAFSRQSIRIDAMSSWDRETQIASRIRMIMSAEKDDNFVNFVWMTVTHITGCLKRVGRRISIVSLLDCVQSQAAAENLAIEVLQKFLVEVAPHFETHVEQRIKEKDGESGKRQQSKGPQIASPRLAAMAEFFKFKVPQEKRPREISGLIAAIEANREWFAKMIIALTPILTKLSSGDLGSLLSPDYQDIEDERPIFNSRRIVEGGYIAYVGLDALSDASVAEAVAAMLLSDMAGTAGEIYNYEAPRSRKRMIHVICDEWGDLVCEPIIQLANKARGAGITLYLAGQTISDIIDKMGSKEKALRILGNLNNLLVGATSDPDTLDYLSTKFGETTINQVSEGASAGQKTEDVGLEFSSNRAVSVREMPGMLVPPNLVMGLPNLQFYGIFNRSEIYQGRIPVLTLH